MTLFVNLQNSAHSLQRRKTGSENDVSENDVAQACRLSDTHRAIGVESLHPRQLLATRGRTLNEMWTALHIRRSFCSVTILMLAGCGGGSGSDSTITAGPRAVLNGSSLSSDKSHWSSNCGTQVELAADGGFKWAVTDTTGTTSSGSSNWSASSGNGAVINFGGTSLGGFSWVTDLTNISGSAASKHFTSGVDVADANGSQNLGTCSFDLQAGAIP